ncbi:substrate-binding domain-containing protein [Conexibacter sp. JD483]|uniref:sugar ABC transporter substrate-binding protein n=1 Tax=unclassified Conexibacter TaxID=2627773 RepID=UPI00271E452D|nr:MULTISPECIES: substrate-binding domain-containing protein [unclassified Conexibacter]MDO8186806.1 substrate-binding domain-containing protein [Conexibacter sp. CPCC 205706]MDO8197440.1 substrate-binding domain-containing protein [Conexibacter sp. CPCC 205762]MDR9370455.1 substrate-binding domain-containing protein [Conexibacter sp. JD483]
MRTNARLAALATMAALALPLTACGSSGDDGGAGTATSATAGAAKSATTAAGAAGANAAAVARAIRRPTSIGIDAPLRGGIPRDKTIWWIQCSSPACVALTKPLKAATDAVGWQLRVVNAGLTPETVKAAWDQAVQGDPDAVIGSGFSRALYEPELKALAERGVPVLNMTTADPPEDGYAATQNYGPDFLAAGRRLAQYVLARGGDDVHAATITVSAFANLGFVARGFSAELKAQCAGCTVDEQIVPATSLGDDLPTRIATYLQAHPDVNWVYVGYADMMVGVPPALASAGIARDKVRFVTLDSLPTTAQYMQDGSYLVAAEGSPKPEMMWRHVDFLLRHFNREPTEPATAHTLPTWTLTAETLPSTTDDFPLVEDYEQQYEALWGVSG